MATPETTEEQKEEKDEEKNEVNTYRNTSEKDEEVQLQVFTIYFILNMEDPNYKDPEPCTGLTCPLTLTREQYYVD